MKAYGRNLRWIEDHQYGDEMHTGIAMPASGKRRGQRRRRYKRPFKKSERQHSKHMIRREFGGDYPAINYTISGADICTVYARN